MHSENKYCLGSDIVSRAKKVYDSILAAQCRYTYYNNVRDEKFLMQKFAPIVD